MSKMGHDNRCPFNNKVHPSMLFKDWIPVTSWESALSSQPQEALKIFVFVKKEFPISFLLSNNKSKLKFINEQKYLV